MRYQKRKHFIWIGVRDRRNDGLLPRGTQTCGSQAKAFCNSARKCSLPKLSCNMLKSKSWHTQFPTKCCLSLMMLLCSEITSTMQIHGYCAEWSSAYCSELTINASFLFKNKTPKHCKGKQLLFCYTCTGKISSLFLLLLLFRHKVDSPYFIHSSLAQFQHQNYPDILK